ncbi:unnamed protein product [Durusdinium trenchii]
MYIPAFKVRCQVRQLLRRIAGFWHFWSPAAALALRPGLSEVELQRFEQLLAERVERGGRVSQLPEDFAEFLRWCDGYEVEAFWCAEAQPGALAFRVCRLLCSAEIVAQAAQISSGWLPVSCSREGALTCLRLEEEDEESATPGAGPGITASVVSPASSASFGELWCGAAPRGSDFESGNLTRQSSSFMEYLQDYVGLLENIARQFAEEQLLTPISLNQVLPQLFSSTRIYCDEQSSWVTTGLGKGKGNLWQRVDRSRPLRIIFPRFHTGKRAGRFANMWLQSSSV